MELKLKEVASCRGKEERSSVNSVRQIAVGVDI